MLQSPEAAAPQRWNQRTDEESQSFPSLLRWLDCNFDLGPVYDVHSDIQIELMHRKLRDHEKQREVVMPQTKGVSELRSFFGKDPHMKQPTSPRFLSPTPKAEPTDGDNDSGDEAETRWRPRLALTVNWTSYGRVVIPLSMWLATSTLDRNEVQTARHTTYRSTPSTPPCMEATMKPGDRARRRLDIDSNALLIKPRLEGMARSIKSDSWYHLYPSNQDESEYKYIKPCSGYPGLGMINPLVSLGFLNVGLEFNRYYNPYLLSLLSNCNSPKHTWITSTKFDLQVFENAGLRLHHCCSFTPRWIRRFCHFGSIFFADKQFSSADIGLLGVFWVTVLFTTVLAPCWFLPIGLMVLIWCVSISYRRVPSDTAGTCHYISPPLPIVNLADASELSENQQSSLAQAFGARSQKTRSILQNWMETAVLNLRNPRLGFMESQPKTSTTASGAFINTPCPGWIPPSLSGTSLDANAEALRNIEIPPPAVASLVMPFTDIQPSTMATVFGRASISVRDTTSYCPAFPVFADDCVDVDLLLLKHLGLMVVEVVQYSSTMTVTFLEKMKFAFDWTDPFISAVSLLIVSVLGLQMALLIWALSCLPQSVLRLCLVFIPAVSLLVLSDPVVSAVTGFAGFVDECAIALFKWQPESAVVCRICQNIWDIFYLQNLLTEEDREARHRLMTQVFESILEKPKLKSDSTPLSSPEMTTMSGTLAETMRKDWLPGFKSKKAPDSEGLGPSSDEFSWKLAGQDFITGLRKRKQNLLSIIQTSSTAPRGPPSGVSELRGDSHGAVGVRSTMTIVHKKQQEELISKSESLLSRSWSVCSMLVRTVASGMLADVVLPVVLYELNFIFNWFLRLPDRREIEHRQIAATQYLGEDLGKFVVQRTDKTPDGARTPSKNAPNVALYDFYRKAHHALSKARGHGGWTGALGTKTSKTISKLA
eukprot:Gregarina_sp_Poly_1__5591@NODE_294_length_9872_cov_66_125038_g254_i0_p1_GENE_NODE_294_length_9872_cov_66_125038_g254_i0NODE_294_length_9872_cov_66_125038_g254_i0_p1_ORF_typecomplete_len936_score123_22PRT_C/PF08372_10/4_6e02PRT_C/PF08372_10/0_029PRT_C/PF08372_10/9_9e03_NODE_294_length_9872_cov_66_125038_g254_i018274634